MKARIAIFGSGKMAKIYASILINHPKAVLIGFVGNNPSKCKALSREFGVPALPYGDYSTLLNSYSVDTVIIATPEWVREDPINAAMEVNANLLIEKPLADNWNSTKKIFQKLSVYPGIVNVCHVLRYSPRFLSVKRSVAHGDIGELRIINSRRNSNNLRVNRVIGKTNLAYWLSPHDLDLMRWITDSEVKSIYSQSHGDLNSSDDFLASLIRFENNVSATAEISWCNPPVSPSARDFSFDIRGTHGLIECDDYDNNVRIFLNESKVLSVDTYEDYTIANQSYGLFRFMVDDFIEHCEHSVKFPSAIPDALEVLRICEMISRSINTKRIILREEVD